MLSEQAHAQARITDLEESSVAAYAEACFATSTKRAYNGDWASFESWCRERCISSLPAKPDDVARYLAFEADRGLSPRTLERRLAAIGANHKKHMRPTPLASSRGDLIRRVLAGIRRSSLAQARKKAPLEAHHVMDMIRLSSGDGLRASRDRAVLALGLAGALRRSEIAALQIRDLEFENDGVRVHIRRSKTDPFAQGQSVSIPHGRRIRPVDHVNRWLARAGHSDGYLFRRLTRGDQMTEKPISDRTVARLVQSKAKMLGLDPRLFGAHSLRSGFLVEAARHNASVLKMSEVSRHRCLNILLEYVRDAHRYHNHAGDGFL